MQAENALYEANRKNARFSKRSKKVHPSTLLYPAGEYSYEGAHGDTTSGPAGTPKWGGTPQLSNLKIRKCYPDYQVLGNARLYSKRFMNRHRRHKNKDWPYAYPKEGDYMNPFPPRTKTYADW